MTDRQVSTVPPGGDRKPYIVRPETTAFLEKLGEAIAAKTGPRLFQVWGVGGVGKTTVLTKAEEALADQAICSRVSFGVTDGIESPMGLMEKLAEPLARDDWGSEFADLIKLYRTTLIQLEQEPAERGQGISAEQKTIAQTLGTIALGWMQRGMPEAKAKAVDELGGRMLESGLNTASAALTLLQRHQATKKDKALQELMLEPIPKLTAAFGKLLRDQRRPVLLLLDTYEKATLEVDTWLWRTLLANQDCGEEDLGQARILVAGRNSLVDEREGWRKLQQDRNCIVVLGLDRFDLLQTQLYLQESGLGDDGEIEQIYGVTKGLPYYLNWIRKEVQAGRKPDFSRGNEDIAKLLLQGLTGAQQRLIEMAACFRQFKRRNLERVLAQLKASDGLDFGAAAGEAGAFGWLTDREAMQFVEKRDGHYRLDDVARDVFRMSLFEADEERFRAVQGLIAADYWAASQRVEPEEAGYRARYKNADWRGPRAAYLYHLLLSGDRAAALRFRSHLLEARYFRVDELVRGPLQDLAGEFGLEQHPFLGDRLRRFLVKLRPAVEQGWAVLGAFPLDYVDNEERLKLSKAQIDGAVETALERPEQLGGLAQFAALVYQSGRCLESRRLGYLRQAAALAAALVEPEDGEFSSGLYLWELGSRFYQYESYEEAIASYDQALEIKPNLYQAWNCRGNSLGNLGRHEDAIASYGQALEIKPDDHEACYNRGVSLNNLLGRYEDAIASYDQALEIKPDMHEAWYNRGISLDNLGRYEDAIASYDQALEIKPEKHGAWANRSVSLYRLERYEEAITSCDKALEIKPDLREAWYNRSLSLYCSKQYEEALTSCDKALKFKPDDHNVWYCQGKSLSYLGRNEEAIASYDKALELKPDYHYAWDNRGDSLRSLGRNEEAIASYQKALDIQPNYRFSWHGMGLALMNLKRYEEAISSYDQALAIKPDYASALYSKACAHALSGHPDPALQALSQAIELNPNHYLPLAQTDSDFDSLRPDPRFQQLLTPKG